MVIYQYYPGLDLQITRINLNFAQVLLRQTAANTSTLIEELHAGGLPILLLQHGVGTADPGVGGEALPPVQLLLHILQDPAVPRLGGHVVPLLRVLLPVKQLPLWSVVILLERNVPGQAGAALTSHQNVLEGGREVAVLVYREGRPVVQIVDQCEPSRKAL